MEQINEYINLTTALLVAIGAALPTCVAIYNAFKNKSYVKALHTLQIAIGEGGTINEVVDRIADAKNAIVEKELPKSGAKIIE